MKKVILTILDGVGINKNATGNAFLMAKKPNFDYLWNNYPHSTLEASGTLVGLPAGQMGNSEVGHLNLGAGRIVYQPLQLINEQIKSGDFYTNKEILDVISHVKTNNSKLHIMGLLSDGGVHSHIDHILALLRIAKDNNVQKLYFHVMTDGRDTLPDCAYKFIQELENNIQNYGVGKIATISGRYYAMDRDNNWDRIKKAYDVMVNGVGETYSVPKDLVDYNYSKDITDEFIIPGIIDKDGIIEDNDGIIWSNYRGDRARELPTAITNNKFEEFETKEFNNLKFVTMMPVSDTVISTHLFKLNELINTLGEYISNIGLKQLRIAETEKYAHVTYFFDGGLEKELAGCDRILIPSPKVATYDLKPEMSCNEITEKLLENMDKYDVIILNYANGDMLGHTGVLDAAIRSIEVLDYNIGRIYKKAQELGFTMIVTADHGNCEEMLDDNNNILTEHSTNKVPCIITDKNYHVKDGKLGDVAPTILKIMEINIPKEMTGNVLI